MQKVSTVAVILVMFASLLSACENAKTPAQTPLTASTPTEPQMPVEASHAGQTGTGTITDNIKWEEVKDPLINDQMKDKLKGIIDAMVLQDINKFHAAIGENLGTAHDYLLDNSMNFTGIDPAFQERGRVRVPVNGQFQAAGDTGKRAAAYTFYFEKNTEGEWKLAAID